jgi:DNA-binding transcriptional ArsR family regulator
MNPSTITTTAAALADITRLRLLLALHDGGLPVGELAKVLSVVPSVVSFHVGKLEAVGLVVTQRMGRRTVVRREQRKWRQVMMAFE